MKGLLYSIVFIAAASVAFVIIFEATRMPTPVNEVSESDALVQPSGVSRASVPRFEEYPVAQSEVFTGEPAPIDFMSATGAAAFRDDILEAAPAQPNFAGRYRVATYSCGAQCRASAIIDAESGDILAHGILSVAGLAHHRESELLIVNPPEALSPDAPRRGIATDYYRLSGDALEHIEKRTFDGALIQPCTPLSIEARNPITDEVHTFSSPCEVPSGWHNEGGIRRVQL